MSGNIVVFAGIAALVVLLLVVVWRLLSVLIQTDADKKLDKALLEVRLEDISPESLIKTAHDNRSNRIQALGTLGQLIGIFALAGTFYLGMQQLNSEREKNYTERYNHAIEQLGSQTGNPPQPNLSANLAGIKTLSEIARDRTHVSECTEIMDLLAAYVRVNSPRKKDDKDDQNISSRPEILQALVAIARRPKDCASHQLGLGETNLMGAILQEGKTLKVGEHANLQNVVLSGSDLRGAELENADLSNSFLVSTNLTCTDLKGATLVNVHVEASNIDTPYLLTQQQVDDLFGNRQTSLRWSLPGVPPKTSTSCATVLDEGTVKRPDEWETTADYGQGKEGCGRKAGSKEHGNTCP